MNNQINEKDKMSLVERNRYFNNPNALEGWTCQFSFAISNISLRARLQALNFHLLPYFFLSKTIPLFPYIDTAWHAEIYFYVQ